MTKLPVLAGWVSDPIQKMPGHGLKRIGNV